jgi:hypothetical protein
VAGKPAAARNRHAPVRQEEDNARPFTRPVRGVHRRTGVPAGRDPRVHPGITSNYDDLKFAGHGSDAQLLGIFDTSVLHNIVHLLFGIAGIALSKSWDGPARS